ncbi:RES domain-containing protein [Microbacterium arborescens]
MDFPEGLQSMDQTICLDHIQDDLLRDLAKAHVTESVCAFCNRSAAEGGGPFAVPMDVVAERMFATMTTYYSDHNEAPVVDGATWEDPLDTSEVVWGIAEDTFSENEREAVLGAVIEAVATPGSWFKIDDRDFVSYSWDQFADTVRHESRFVLMSEPRPGGDYDPPARLARFLNSLLGYVEHDAGMLMRLRKGDRLYRGRMTDDAWELAKAATKAPAAELGAAPRKWAQPGRMSGEGVPLFYAADDRRTAIAEIALHSPYDEAVVGEFTVQEDLTILDFTLAPVRPSIYDLEKADQHLFIEFVDHFVEAITQPIILDGRQRVDYLPTQVVTEYLRWVPHTRIDGIAFPSHTDETRKSKNIVLFTRPEGDVMTDPPTAEEQELIDWTEGVGGTIHPRLTIKSSGVSKHTVKRRVESEEL